MEPATQVDLAKAEVPPAQVVDSALGGAADHLTVELVGSSRASPGTRSPRKHSRGASVTTNQIRLKPKKGDRSPSPLPKDGDPARLEFGSFDAKGATFELQPVDQGFGAWSYVASTFAFYIVVWGFPQAFPIFQTYLSTGPTARYPGSVAIRLLAPGLQDIEEGILFPLLPTNSKYRQVIVILGIVIIMVAMLLASFATADWQVVLVLGVLFGIGGILLNYVHVSIFSEWFDKKKGQAMGIIWTGWRVGALAFPLVCQELLDKHGYEQTLRVLIVPMLALLVPSVVLLRGRYHAATIVSKPTQRPISKLQALRAPDVLYYLISACLFYLVVNVPKMFITTFAADLGLSGSAQALILSVLVLSDMVGTYLFGWLSDSVFDEGVTALLAAATSVSNIFGLGFAKSRPGVLLYAITVGLASGGFSNCLFTFFAKKSHQHGEVDGELFTAIHGLFSLFRGIAILSVGPVGAALLLRSSDVDIELYAIGKYKYLAIYAATMSMTSGMLIYAKTMYPKLGRKPVAGPIQQPAALADL